MSHSWLWQRLHCLFSGHRGLLPGALWTTKLPDGRLRELHFCSACETPIWVERRRHAGAPDAGWTELEDHTAAFRGHPLGRRASLLPATTRRSSPRAV